MNEVEMMFNNFIDLLNKRTINAIENLEIKESCTATLLLLFAAIDSLSKITCSKSDYNKGNGVRFTGFLKSVMGNKYANRRDEIYKLRNNIVHTGVNTKVTLSKGQDHNKHLEIVNGYLWINTNQFLFDFKNAITQIKKDIDSQGPFYQFAKDRIKDFNLIKLDEEHDQASPSPGPDKEPI